MEKGKPLGKGRLKISSDFTKVLTKWLTIFSEHFGKEISPVSAAIYERGLAHLSPEELERACAKTLRTSRYLPTLADILHHSSGHLVQLAEKSLCDEEWVLVLENLGTLNLDKRTVGPGYTLLLETYKAGAVEVKPIPKTPLSEAAVYAIRCLGGLGAFEHTAAEFLPQLKKRWDEFYLRSREKEILGLTDGQAGKILSAIQRKQLAGKSEERKLQ